MLTKAQIFHRTESLSGELKAAREAQSECRKAHADQERLTTIAAQAVERADARVLELEAERADLAEQARLAILNVGDPPPVADETAPNVPVEFAPAYKGMIEGADFAFDTPECHQAGFGNNHYTNGISDAFERATNP